MLITCYLRCGKRRALRTPSSYAGSGAGSSTLGRGRRSALRATARTAGRDEAYAQALERGGSTAREPSSDAT